MSRYEKIIQNKSTKIVYQGTRNDKEPRRWPMAPYLIIFILLVGLVYFLFFSGVFDIKKREIIGYNNSPLIEEIIENHCNDGWLSKNIFLFDIKSLADVIKGDSGVKKVEIKKVYPNTIKVMIEESVGVLNWNTAGESFVVDGRGYIIEINNIKELPQVYDNANIKVSLGERVASPTFIKYIIDLSDNFEPVTGHKVSKIIIFDIFSDVHVQSKSGWTVYFDSTRDPMSQLNNLAKVLRQAKSEGYKDIQYIDMRLDNKVFYK